MKNSKKILVLLLSLALVFALFACGKCEHEDANKDGVCDKCGEEVEVEIADVALIEDGEPTFQFVMETGLSSDVVKAVDKIIKALKEYDINVERVTDKADNAKDIEVLIGDVTTRGDAYKIDKYALGPKGYVIRIVDSKILINAGSHAQLADAVEEFGNDILGLADEPDELLDIVMTAEQMVEDIQSNYKVTALKINGVDIRGYTLAVDTSIAYHKSAAEFFQSLVYERTGYRFEIVSLDKADKSIIFKGVAKDATVPEGFKISANDKNQLVIECAYDNMFERAVSDFIMQKITSATGEVELKDGFVRNVSVLCYDDFGAVGDGKTNDYEAIYKTHVTANECGQSVVATVGKTYYLGSPVIHSAPTSIPIKTDADWNGAKFIIDDREIHKTAETKKWNVPVFSVEQDTPSVTYSKQDAAGKAFLDAIIAQGLNRNTTKIELGDGYDCPVMLITANATHKVYRRRAYSGYAGAVMEEVIILDKDGNITGGTEVMYDYIDLTGLSVVKLDDIKPITLKNGEFTTRASQANTIVVESDGYRSTNSSYTSRGFTITRSFTTLENIKHYVTDEVPFSECFDDEDKISFVAPCYRGFYIVRRCTDVTVKDSVLTGRRCYRRPDNGTGGTYDLSAGLTNNLVFEGCVQSNFWVTVDSNFNVKPAKEGDPEVLLSMDAFPGKKVVCDTGRVLGCEMHWGIGGTNLCKNTKYINSTLSRYDAHEGTYGGVVKNSTVNTIALTGAGDFYIEDTRVFHDSASIVFSTRRDYGYTWDGTVYIKNVSSITEVKTDGVYSDEICVTAAEYEGRNWYWGYHPTMPNIVIDNLIYYDSKDYNPQTKAYAQVPDYVPVYLYGKSTISADFKEHLSRTVNSPIYSVEDKDSDGYIDIPDIDGDGVWGNTPWKYNEIMEFLGRDYDQGFTVQDIASLYPTIPNEFLPDQTFQYTNFSRVTPPEYAKILGNAGGYKYYVTNTATSGVSSDGHYGIQNNKGFFGSTKFYYSETEFHQGPPANDKEYSDGKFVFY